MMAQISTDAITATQMPTCVSATAARRRCGPTSAAARFIATAPRAWGARAAVRALPAVASQCWDSWLPRRDFNKSRIHAQDSSSAGPVLQLPPRFSIPQLHPSAVLHRAASAARHLCMFVPGAADHYRPEVDALGHFPSRRWDLASNSPSSRPQSLPECAEIRRLGSIQSVQHQSGRWPMTSHLSPGSFVRPVLRGRPGQRGRARVALLGFALTLLALGLLARVSVQLVRELKDDADNIARAYDALHAFDALKLARSEQNTDYQVFIYSGDRQALMVFERATK